MLITRPVTKRAERENYFQDRAVLIRAERKMTSKVLYALLHAAHSDSVSPQLYSVVF
jgi:hypothetical protein